MEGSRRGSRLRDLFPRRGEDRRRAARGADGERGRCKFETRADGARGDPLSFLLNDMAQNEHLRESNELAELIQRRLGGSIPARTAA